MLNKGIVVAFKDICMYQLNYQHGVYMCTYIIRIATYMYNVITLKLKIMRLKVIENFINDLLNITMHLLLLYK